MKAKAKMSDLDDGSLLKIYVSLRDRRAQRKNEYTAADAGDKAKQDKIEMEFLQRFDTRGIDNVSTRGVGTAYRSTRTSATVADFDALLEYVKEQGAWELLEKRVSKTAVEQHVQVNDELPPGVNWRETYTVNIKRS